MVTTCTNCLAASNHDADTRVNFCFFCGYELRHLSSEPTGLRFMETDWVSRKNRIKKLMDIPVDWDEEFKREFKKSK